VPPHLRGKKDHEAQDVKGVAPPSETRNPYGDRDYQNQRERSGYSHNNNQHYTNNNQQYSAFGSNRYCDHDHDRDRDHSGGDRERNLQQGDFRRFSNNRGTGSNVERRQFGTSYPSNKHKQNMSERFEVKPSATQSSQDFRNIGTGLNADKNTEKQEPADVNVSVNENSKDEDGKERHPDLDAVETIALGSFFTQNSSIFKTWESVRAEGYENKHISGFFEKKKANAGPKSKRSGAHVGADIGRIFKQFFEYAIDIDNGVAYSERAAEIAMEKGSCWFLDFGFAPGGMSDVLLTSHPEMRGIGVSLDPAEGGNVYLDSLKKHDRFTPLIGDVIEMARNDLDIVKAANLPPDFDGFDFAIVGITIHQEWEGENVNELKDLLHFSQLYLSLKYLKPGGMVLMRMHMSLRLIDCHFLSLMLSLFDIEKFSGKTVGRSRIEKARAEKIKGINALVDSSKHPPAPAARKAESSLDRLVKKLEKANVVNEADFDVRQHVNEKTAWWNLNRTAVATKPFSTFSMRKTFWVLYHGFDCSDERRKEILQRLMKIIQPDVFAYGYNAEEKHYNMPIVMPEPIDTLLQKYGMKMISVLEDVWEKQVIALRGFMVGLTDKRCRKGMHCRRRDCNMAHRDAEMIPEVLAALRAVSYRSNPRLEQLHIH